MSSYVNTPAGLIEIDPTPAPVVSKKGFALCIKTADLAIPEFFEGVFSESDYANLCRGRSQSVRHPLMHPCSLENRDTCESDLSLLQLLPYAALRTRIGGKVYIAVYQRGKAGNEPGLHDKWSIGFGGHVDSAPSGGNTITHHLASELQRELSEEIGVHIKQERLHRLISNCSYIRLKTTSVDAVHLGLPVVIDVSETLRLVSQEPDQICNLRWVDRDELMTMALESRLENWSQLMVNEELV